MLIYLLVASYDVKMKLKDVFYIISKRKQAYEFDFIAHNRKDVSQLILKVLSREVGKQLYERLNTIGNEKEKGEIHE